MTPFAKKVYKIVLSIPLGNVRTYKWVAEKAGRPRAYRAVGTILKNNPYPLIIPCHRVVKSDKKLGNYVFGIKKKKLILDLERVINLILLKKKIKWYNKFSHQTYVSPEIAAQFRGFNPGNRFAISRDTSFRKSGLHLRR